MRSVIRYRWPAAIVLALAVSASCRRPGPKEGEFDMPYPSAESLLVLPCPREWTPRPGILRVHGRIDLQGDVDRAEARTAVEALRGNWPEFAVSSESNPKIILGIPGTFAPLDAELKEHGLKLPDAGGDEAYLLDIRGSRVVLAARAAPGLMYGALTLLQMVRTLSDVPTLPSGTLRDWPAFPLRGGLEDLAAGQVPTVANFKQILSRMARLKLNTSAVYLDDIYRFDKHPSVGKGRAALQRAEVRELAKYGADLNISLVPVFPVLGHLRRILSLPEYAKFAAPGPARPADGGASAPPDLLNPLDEGAVAFLEELLGEIADAFPSDLVILRAGDADDMARLAAMGDAGKIYAGHLAKLAAFLSAKGKKVAVLFDPQIAPVRTQGRVSVSFAPSSGVQDLPRACLLAAQAPGVWEAQSGESDPVFAPLRRLGFQVCDAARLDPRPTVFPAYGPAFAHMRSWAQAAFREGAAGSILSAWGGESAERLRELNLRGLAFQSECAWNPKAADFQFFRRKYSLRVHGCGQPNWEELYDALESVDADLPPAPPDASAQVSFFYQDPTPVVRSKAEEEKIQARATRLEKAREWLRHHRSEHAHHEEGVLDYVDHALDRAVILMDMLRVRGAWGKELQSAPHPSAALRDRVRKVANDLQRHRDKYQALWLRSCRPEGLPPNTDRIEKLIGQWIAATTK